MSVVAPDKPTPLSHRLRVIAAINGATIELSRTDLLEIARIVEFHEQENPIGRMAALTHEHLRLQLYTERLAGFACALMAANAALGILQAPVAVLASLISGLLQ